MQTLESIHNQLQQTHRLVSGKLSRLAEASGTELLPESILSGQFPDGLMAVGVIDARNNPGPGELAFAYLALGGNELPAGCYILRFPGNESGPEPWCDLLTPDGKLAWQGKLSAMPQNEFPQGAEDLEFQGMDVLPDPMNPEGKIWLLRGRMHYGGKPYAFTLRIDQDKFRPGYWK